MTNCPNCGAPITGYRCEYCETVFDISTQSHLDKEIELLRSENERIQYHIAVQDLYAEAIRAIRKYAY